MNDTIEAEVVTQAVARRSSSAVGQALGVDEIIAQVELIQKVMKRVMTDGEHYGTIPGCGDKKTLLQPGAQKLTMTFRLAPEYKIQEVNLERGHKEYQVICTLKTIGNGSFAGQGVGCCSSMESKYRWRGGARRCPECGKEAIIKGKADFGGGWLCWQKKGGCGQKWDDGAAVIESQSIDKVENENPADTFNTVLKMAKKRAFVDATITATAASDIFTQDIGDDEGEHDSPPAPAKALQTSQRPASAPAKPQTTTKLKPPTEETRKWMIAAFKDEETELCEYFSACGYILETENLYDLPLKYVPFSKDELKLLKARLEAFRNGEQAQPAFDPHLDAEDGTGLGPEPGTDPTNPNNLPPEPSHEEAWRDFPMPYGKHAGTPLSKLLKNYLFGLWANYAVEKEYNGKPKTPEQIAKDQTFRVMLDDAGKHYEFTKK